MRKVIGIRTKYLNMVPFIGVIPFVCLFFNYININESSEHFTGYQLIKEFTNLISGKGISFTNVFIIAILIILPIIILALSIVAFLRPSKKILYFVITFYALEVVGYTAFLLTAKGILDASGLLELAFLIKYLSIGYWISLLFHLIGLVIAMRSVKMSPGYIVLATMSVIWLFPIVWIIFNSFRGEGGFYIGYFIPKTFTLNNYIKVITDTSKFKFAKWYGNTLLVSSLSCIITSCLVLSTSYVLSRIRFSGRKPFMNLLLILGMFPGFMSMIAVYYIIKGLGLNQSLAALVIVYSAGASLGYYISKGFFDTIPRSLDEAAFIDGATKWDVFTKIIIPLSKSIIIYTVLTSFMGPWADYIFSSIILGDNQNSYTVAIGLFNMISRDNIEGWYTAFAAGSILIGLPISILFLSLQKYYVEGLSGSVKG